MPRDPAPFVVGLSRSGTTLLRMMLDAHPALAIPTGTFFIPDALRLCSGSADPAASFLNLLTRHWKWPDFHLDAGTLRQRVEAIAPFDLGEALRALYGLYAARFGKLRWGDKSAYLWHMEAVQQALPEAAFVHIIRDGRDVALSIRPLHWGPSTMAEAGDWWASGIARAREQAPRLSRYLEVRYEALVTDPEAVLRRVCDFIELPFDAAMLDYHRRAPGRLAEMVALWDPTAGRMTTPEERRATHAGVDLPPQPARAGRWRREMTGGERGEFEGRAGAVLAELGYGLSERPVVLCVVDRPGWSHDRKTEALASALADRYRIVRRFQHEVTVGDLESADLVLLYYWLQVDRLGDLAATLRRRHDRLLLGICSELELDGAWREPGLALLAELPRAVFANSLALVRKVEPKIGRPVLYTPNGVDTDFFRPPAAPHSSGSLRVGWAGSLTNHGPDPRGVHQFIAPAVARVPGARLCLAAREERWRGLEEMRDFYHSLDVYVCASQSEGTPNPCLEAAACGLPIVTTRVGNMPELIRHGESGFFVERDVADIAGRLDQLRRDPELRARLGHAARTTVEAWDWRHQAANFDAMFRGALDGIDGR